jgi:hypothetical protein
VSTGNWTRQTVEESLDLAWSIEVDSAELAAHDGDHASELAERCADVKAAWGLLGFLQGLFDLRLLDAGRARRHSETVAARDSLAAWVARCVAAAGPRARFIDNRRQSLLEQLVPMLRAQAGEGAQLPGDGFGLLRGGCRCPCRAAAHGARRHRRGAPRGGAADGLGDGRRVRQPAGLPGGGRRGRGYR